jgi:MFS family permease
MKPHWRIAIRYVVLVSVGALVAGVAIWLSYGASYAWAFIYGVAMGLLSFASMAVTVSMLTERSTAAMMLGAGSFVARCVFAAVTLGIPAYLSLWPVLAMLGGFAVVYLAENVLLLLMMPRKISRPNAKNRENKPGQEGAQRKVGI